MEWVFDPNIWIALAALTALELILGIDNIVFISILASKLPPEQQPRARTLGLGAAMLTRVILLLCITWVMELTNELFEVFGRGISGRDLILIGGGLFLIGKATFEIHDKLEGAEGAHGSRSVPRSFAMIIVQIMILDLVFSLDSVITAVGMTDVVGVMIAAIVIAIGFMMLSAGVIARFVERHPTVKMLALSFLILIGVALLGEGADMHMPRGYIYFAMGFSLGVEMLNMRLRAKRYDPVHLHGRHRKESERMAGEGASAISE